MAEKGLMSPLYRLGAEAIKHSGLVVLRAVVSTAETASLIARNPAAKLGRYVRNDLPARERVGPDGKVQLSHSSIRVTADTYVPWLPGGNRAAVDRLDDPRAASHCNPHATDRGETLATIIIKSG